MVQWLNPRKQYGIGEFGNRTAYRLFSSELQEKLTVVLRREDHVELTPPAQADVVFSGEIIEVRKSEREKDEYGKVIETQMVISLELLVTKDGVLTRHRIKNTDFRSSSGTFRSDRTPLRRQEGRGPFLGIGGR